MDEFERVAETSERLKEAIRTSGKKQIDIAKETGIDKGSISNYVSGRYEPKLPAIKKLANALDVDEMWLWGHDVPRERSDPAVLVPAEISAANDIATRLVYKMRDDDAFLSAVERLMQMDEEQLTTFARMENEQIAAFIQLYSSLKKE